MSEAMQWPACRLLPSAGSAQWGGEQCSELTQRAARTGRPVVRCTVHNNIIQAYKHE